MVADKAWRSRESFPLTRENLVALFENEIPEIRIPGFATPAECAGFTAAMRGGNVQTSTKSGLGYIGAAQVNYRWGGNAKQDYFAVTPRAWADFHAVVDRAWNPLERLMDRLRAVLGKPVEIAEEPGGGRCFAGIIRLAEKGTARHVDYAPLNMPGWGLADIDAQIAWNLFFTAPAEGGQTTIWNRPWDAPVIPGEDPPQSYGLGDEWVAGAETWTYRPAAGDVVLFNSRNPHRVDPTLDGGQRWQIGSFVGRRPDGSLILWS